MLHLSGTDIRDTGPLPWTQGAGFGIASRQNTLVRVNGGVLAENHSASLSAAYGASVLEATGVLVQDSLSTGPEGEPSQGFGAWSTVGASLDLRSSVLSGSRGGGVVVDGAGATLTDVVVLEVGPSLALETRWVPAEFEYADGVIIANDASAALTRLVIGGADRAALHVRDSAATGDHVLVQQSLYGALVGQELVPLSSLGEGNLELEIEKPPELLELSLPPPTEESF